MKKSLLWLLIMLLTVSMVATFSLAGCKGVAEEEEVVAEEEEVAAEEEEAVPAKLVILTHWTDPWMIDYWDETFAEYMELNPAIEIEFLTVEYDAFYEKILTMRAAGEDPDIIHGHQMWIPAFAEAGMLTTASDAVAADVADNFAGPSVDGVTYNGSIYGYPTEYISWFLVYNKPILEAAGYTEPPSTWAEFQEIAIACTDKEPRPVVEEAEEEAVEEAVEEEAVEEEPTVGGYGTAGFLPFYDVMPEEQLMQFANLLWANGGELWDLETKEVLFNDEKGVEALKLYTDLMDVSYNPQVLMDYWWDAWANETIAMMILPSWMSYLYDAMGDNFTNLGIAPVPVPEEGMDPVSLTYGWVTMVTERAERIGTADAAWDLLEWMNEPQPETEMSKMGDFLIERMITPARISDQENNEVFATENPGFWYRAGDQIAADYGRSYEYNENFEEFQFILGSKLEEAWLGTLTPEEALNDAAAQIEAIMAGM